MGRTSANSVSACPDPAVERRPARRIVRARDVKLTLVASSYLKRTWMRDGPRIETAEVWAPKLSYYLAAGADVHHSYWLRTPPEPT